MAEILDDGEFWLPPQFLTDDDDDDFSVDSRADNLKSKAEFGLVSDSVSNKGGFFSIDSPFGGYASFGGFSDFSSPVESVVGSTETESDEEDTLLSLTCQMARSKVVDDFGKSRTLSTSPQSTLCRQGSSGGSPNGPCQVSSPPATWDLLYAAAGEVAKMRMNSEDGFGLNQSNMFTPRKPSPIGVPVKDLNAESATRLQIAQIQLLKQQQMLKQQQQGPGIWGRQTKGTGHFQPQQVVQNRARNNEFIGGGGRGVRPLGLSPSAWPPLQPQNGSGMRAVLLGGPPAKRECAGTGVFLPRRKVGASESRKKPACSTVLLPARVVQALNLNLEEPRFNGTKSSHSQKRSNNLRPPEVINPELRLPQEWTY